MLQCVAVCCGVWQCVAVCCGVLQCVAMCVAVCCSVLQCAARISVTVRTIFNENTRSKMSFDPDSYVRF